MRIDASGGSVVETADHDPRSPSPSPSPEPVRPAEPNPYGASSRRRPGLVVAVAAVLVVLAGATIVAVLASRSKPAAVSSDRPSDSPVATRYTGDLRQL